ncbi:hypothetical protein [Amycolatopsis rubida]|uniref:DUF4177 domain-containing protein n=1 Tax=Amycolatopsis rubida TaxID=112413 RepID=A0A1I5ZK77_9PSEU|nr:hypothetical protein [Amycolatopsis rubida]SFQ56872.1 hypothetical protein SAMN05421854_115151 [Amycolatopsis rubida]
MQTDKLKVNGFDYGKTEEDLTELGKDGWEAISTLAPSFGSGQAIEVSVILEHPAA